MLHIGLSGYDYKEWQGEGLFYPADLKKAKYFEYYATRYNSLESNGTFQRIPTEGTVAKWIDNTPEGFTVSPKMVQNVTHFKRLGPEAIAIAEDFVRALEPLALAGKLGPIFLQLPPNLKRDDNRLQTFLDSMPGGKRWAIEFRNESWNAPEILQFLRDRNIAWVIAETDDEPVEIIETADFNFIRMRKIDYTESEIKTWIARLENMVASGKDCFVYCRHKDTDGPWRWADQIKSALQ